MKFKLGDTVRVIGISMFFDQVGRITEIEKTGLHPRPFGVSGLKTFGGTVCYGPDELILADPLNVMLNDPEGQQLVQAIHERKEQA